MTYVKAGGFALLAAVALGAATGAWRVLVLAVERLRPEDRQVVLSQSISEAMSCAAFYATLMIPLGFVIAYFVRRRRKRPKTEPT